MSSPREPLSGRSRTAELQQRARDLLVQLALISEGSTTAWDPGHGRPESRAPVAGVRASRPDSPPSKDESLHDHWAWKFAHARDDEQLFWYVLLAEEDLIRARKAPPVEPEIGPERLERILATKGPPERVAIRMHINVSHVRTLRRAHDQDPETGEALPAEREDRLELARALAEADVSERQIAQRTGIPRSTLQRLLHAPP